MTEETARAASPAVEPGREQIRPLLDAGRIAARVNQLGRELTAHYAQGDLTVLGVMTGGLLFCADLVRRIDRPLQVGVLHARSYRGAATSPGELTLAVDMLPELAGRHVLILDDIFDTGRTLSRIVAELQDRNPASLKTAVLLSKNVERQTDLRPDWVGFDIENEFVVGYGLDFNDEHRGRPDIGALVHEQPTPP